jgi:hypothetical protein
LKAAELRRTGRERLAGQQRKRNRRRHGALMNNFILVELLK